MAEMTHQQHGDSMGADVGSMSHDMAGSMHEHMGVNCDGMPSSHGGGTLIGHVLPGALFIVWGSWWAYNVCLRSAVMTTNKMGFGSNAWYRFPARFQLVEPVLKIILPCVALSMELFFDHLNEPSPYQSLYCPKGTKQQGEFAGDNVNNWQHASSYPAVIVSGLVDVLSNFVELPSGVTRAFSSLWIGIMSFLMFVHEKHEALDKMVHWLLAMSMFIAFVFQALEIYAEHSAVVSMGKAASTIFVGAWLVQIGRMMYTGAPEWSNETSRGIGAMMAPIFFCMIFLLICVCILVLYSILLALQRRNMVPKRLLTTVVDGHEKKAVDVLPRTAGRQGHGHRREKEVDFEMGQLLATERSFDSDSAHD
jgi:hypothetical protein